MRAIWSGAINFGLINIPVKLYSAVEQTGPKFRYLHGKDMGPIRFAKVCNKDGHEIPYEEIVRGYEYQKGNYIVMTDEDFEKADLGKTNAISITNFVDEKEIDPIYFVKPYYLEPDKGAEKPYALLREALRKSKKVAVAQFVLRKKEHLGIIKPEDEVIVLEEMRFSNEIRPVEDLNLPQKMNTKDEVELALRLIDQLRTEFDISKYHDTYKENLEEIIAEKSKGKKPTAKGKPVEITEVPDLLGALKQSLEKEEKSVKK